MAVEILTLVSSLVLMSMSIIAALLTLRLLKSIGTQFFKNALVFFLALALWSTTWIVPSLLFNPQFYDFVLNWIFMFSPFGYLALSFMIAAMESVKGEKRTFAKNSGFFLVGGLIAAFYIPDIYQLHWDASGWIHHYSVLYEMGRGVLFLLVVYSTLPLIVRLFKRLRISMRKDYRTRILFWTIVTILPFILLLQPFRGISPAIMQPLFHPSVMLLMITLFLAMLVNLFLRHPTILFVGTQEIEELYVIRQDSGLPLYHYSFLPNIGSGGTEILSAFFTGIRHYVKHSLGSGEIQQILVGDYELSIHEGIFTYGILIAKKSTNLAKNLLRVFVEEFEKGVGFEYTDHVEPRKYQVFNKIVKRYFEFAISITDMII